MALLDRLKNIFRRLDKSSSLKYGYVTDSVTPVYPDNDIDTYIAGYTHNASVYTIIKKAARKFSCVIRYLAKIEDNAAAAKYKMYMQAGVLQKALSYKKKAYSIEQAPTKGAAGLEQLLLRPNPLQGQSQFFEAAYTYYLMTGEAFIWLNRGDVGDEDTEARKKMPVLEMFVLPSDMIEIVPDPADVWGVRRYIFDINGKRSEILPCDIIHWRTFNPLFDAHTRTHMRGLSPLKPGNKVVTQDDDATDAAVAMYQNGGARGVLFEESMRDLTAAQKAQIENITAKRINNKDMKSAVANLQGKWGYHDIGKDSVDLQLLEGQDKAFAKLANLIGVMPGLFLVDQTYENQRRNQKRLLTELIIPDCDNLHGMLTEPLLKAFGVSGHEIAGDYEALPEMQEEIADMVETLGQAPVTLNEIREAIGYDALTLEGMDTVYVGSDRVPVDEVLNAMKEAASYEDGSGGDKSL